MRLHCTYELMDREADIFVYPDNPGPRSTVAPLFSSQYILNVNEE